MSQISANVQTVNESQRMKTKKYKLSVQTSLPDPKIQVPLSKSVLQDHES